MPKVPPSASGTLPVRFIKMEKPEEPSPFSKPGT